jgi:hypothetical protein
MSAMNFEIYNAGIANLSQPAAPNSPNISRRNKMKYVAIFMMVFLIGCDCKRSACISNIDKPAPDPYAAWERQGESNLDVMKAYLECGGTHPLNNSEFAKKVPYNFNGETLAEICLEHSGYNRVVYSERKPTCSKAYNKKYPACQPDAVIPVRSVERRLNSEFCKHYPKNPACSG